MGLEKNKFVILSRLLCIMAGGGATVFTAQPLWMVLVLFMLLIHAVVGEYNRAHTRQYRKYERAIRRLNALAARGIQKEGALEFRETFRMACSEVEASRPLGLMHWMASLAYGGSQLGAQADQIGKVVADVSKLEKTVMGVGTNQGVAISALHTQANALAEKLQHVERTNATTMEDVQDSLVRLERAQDNQVAKIAKIDAAITAAEIKADKRITEVVNKLAKPNMSESPSINITPTEAPNSSSPVSIVTAAKSKDADKTHQKEAGPEHSKNVTLE